MTRLIAFTAALAFGAAVAIIIGRGAFDTAHSGEQLRTETCAQAVKITLERPDTFQVVISETDRTKRWSSELTFEAVAASNQPFRSSATCLWSADDRRLAFVRVGSYYYQGSDLAEANDIWSRSADVAREGF